nr:caspase family protein [Mycobacterium sp. 852013-50091_SCH5140682]
MRYGEVGMGRGGVFIGVDQTGGLQRLNDAAKGAERMHAWAVQQGMVDGTQAKLITDAAGIVTPDQIFDAIDAITGGAGVEQLIVYFAGHGVNISRGEKWLLSRAPDNPNAAVDLAETIEFARYGDVQHVVFISDACRVAPEGIQAQSVKGSCVFPNTEPDGAQSKPVDVFYACGLGRTAAEIKDPAVAAGNYSALYTNAMLDALDGTRPDVLEPGETPGDTFHYVRPDGLQQYLLSELTQRVRALGLLGRVNQNPDAIIASRHQWLARLTAPPPAAGGPPIPPPPTPLLPTLGSLTADLVRSAVATHLDVADVVSLPDQLDLTRDAPVPGATDLVLTAERIAEPFGPKVFETECGIKVRGARMVDAFATRAELDMIAPDGQVLRINGIDGPAASVLVTFERGDGALVPCMPGFITGLTFDDGELVDIACEPCETNWRWSQYAQRADEIRSLRGVASSSAQHGRFRLDRDDAPDLARQMQYAKGIDPTIAVYAAYAYYDLQTVGRIDEMSNALRGDLGVSIFDVELLARKLVGRHVTINVPVVPFVPLLSQGWHLLNAHGIRLHPALDGIERTMRDSLWSLFGREGVGQLRNALQRKDVR